jgi:hypothetical protein
MVSDFLCRAFFPLTNGSQDSYPLGLYTGSSRRVQVVNDSAFGNVFRCNRASDSALLFEPMQYAANGSFSVNFWMRSTDPTGSQVQYLFSHQSAAADNSTPDAWGPNQVGHGSHCALLGRLSSSVPSSYLFVDLDECTCMHLSAQMMACMTHVRTHPRTQARTKTSLPPAASHTSARMPLSSHAWY